MNGLVLKLVIPLTAAARRRELDLSGNRLPTMAPMAALPCLHTLNLSGNEMRGVGVWPQGAFASLEVLDVSFNRLGAECLVQLSTLPSLKELDVSGEQPKFSRKRGRSQACCAVQHPIRALQSACGLTATDQTLQQHWLQHAAA